MNIEPGTIAAVVAGFNIAVTIGGGFYFVGRVTGRMDAHEANATRVEVDVREMKGLLVSSAVEADRLRRCEEDVQGLETDVRNLRRGVGFINDAGARSVDREY